MNLSKVQKICVIGAGIMGTDIAQVFAAKGFKVLVSDISEEITSKAAARLEKNASRLLDRGKISAEDKTSMLACVSFTTDLNKAADADLVIEAIIEDVEIKKGLFKTLDGICKDETILASNTSTISITELASSVKRKDRFIGLHFFNPATVMKLVEVIRGAGTSDGTVKEVFELCQAIEKEPIEVNDAPGFVVNKILVPMINEAVGVLMEGVASAEDIDKAMRLGANHPMGPLALSDLIGNDTVLHIMEILHSETGDPRYRPSMLLRKMVRAGQLGKKSGKGFFEY